MKIPITKPYFSKEAFRLIKKPLETGWLVQGPYVKKLEEKFANYIGATHAIAMNSCTSTQMVASRCIGLKPGDEVLVPAFTWISTANSAEFLGAKAVFVDIDLRTYHIDVDKIEEKITKKTRAIYPVSLFGLPCNLPKIMELARRYNLKVIEDSACSLGGWIKSRHCGTFGDIGCFSFHPRKSITTGEGGMLVTDNNEYAKIARNLRDHGANRSDLDRHIGKQGFLLPEYDKLGYNFRMTDIQGTIGVAQMNILDKVLRRRREKALYYSKLLKKIDFLTPPFVPESYRTGWQSYVCLFEKDRIDEVKRENNVSKQEKMIEALSKKRNAVMYKLEKRGISTRQGTHCVTIQKYYSQKYRIKPTDFLNAYLADRASFTLPLYVTMTKKEQEQVIKNLLRIYKKLTGEKCAQ